MKSVIPDFELEEVMEVCRALDAADRQKWVALELKSGLYYDGKYFTPFIHKAKRYDSKTDAVHALEERNFYDYPEFYEIRALTL